MLSKEKRTDLLDKLGKYMLSNDEQWQDIQERATLANAWFTKQAVDFSVQNIARQYLDKDKLQNWMQQYTPPRKQCTVGMVMAGNIPLVGFHDFLCGFVSGHHLRLKLSSKDEVLLRHLISRLAEWEPGVAEQVTIADNLKGCDAYIATGSNNTSRYFEQYFGKYPNIIRKNRTSVAIMDGAETEDELNALAEDIFSYFGLGCRNVTQVCVPEGYDLEHLLNILGRHSDPLANHHKYKNNYDYYLAIYLLNRVPYLSEGSLLLVENELPFSAVSVLHYRYYRDRKELTNQLSGSPYIQNIVGYGHLPFGSSQMPSLDDYADGVDTMAFLTNL